MTPQRALAGIALLLGLLAPLASSGPGPGAIGTTELVARLGSPDASIRAIDLADSIRVLKAPKILDLRSPDQFTELHVPTAVHVEFSQLRDRTTTDDSIVLCDDGDGTAQRAWLLLRRLGRRDVRVLEGGFGGWIDGVLQPVLPDSTAEQRAEFERVARISRFFGGMPRAGVPPPSTSSSDEAVKLLRGRGCL